MRSGQEEVVSPGVDWENKVKICTLIPGGWGSQINTPPWQETGEIFPWMIWDQEKKTTKQWYLEFPAFRQKVGEENE